MEGDGNSSRKARGKISKTNDQKRPFPIVIEIELESEREKKHRESEVGENSKSQKQVFKRSRKSRASSSYVIDAHVLPEDVQWTVAVSVNDSETRRIYEPFYLSKDGHVPRKTCLPPCRCNKKDVSESDLDVLFKGGIHIEEITFFPLNSSNSCQDENKPLDLGTIRVTASLSTQIPLLLKLITPILAKHLDFSPEALERASLKKEGLAEILKCVNSLLSQKTLVCEFSGVKKEKSQKSNLSTLSSHVLSSSVNELDAHTPHCSGVSGSASTRKTSPAPYTVQEASSLFHEEPNSPLPETNSPLLPEPRTPYRVYECNPPILAHPILCSFTQEIAMSEEEVSSFSAAPASLKMAQHVPMGSVHRSSCSSDRGSKRFMKVCSPGAQVTDMKSQYFVDESRRPAACCPPTETNKKPWPSPQIPTSQQPRATGIRSSLFAEKVRKSNYSFQKAPEFPSQFNQVCPPVTKLIECPTSCPYHRRSKLFQEEDPTDIHQCH